tara:strand:+ start:418 stop:612 length:195 start_codon:yes stop_codon:yes gene_type:complete
MSNAIVSVITSNAKPRGPLGVKLRTAEIAKFHVASNPREIRLFKLSPNVKSLPNNSKFKVSTIA